MMRKWKSQNFQSGHLMVWVWRVRKWKSKNFQSGQLRFEYGWCENENLKFFIQVTLGLGLEDEKMKISKFSVRSPLVWVLMMRKWNSQNFQSGHLRFEFGWWENENLKFFSQVTLGLGLENEKMKISKFSVRSS